MSRSIPRACRAALLILPTLLFSTAARAQQNGDAARKPIDPANIDTSCTACRDFYQFANGAWLSTHSIPAAYTTWGTMNELSDQNDAVARQILEEARTNRTAAAGSNVEKIGTFYGSCMDTARIEADGVKPLEPTLRQIAALRTAADVQRLVGTLDAKGESPLFGFRAAPDPKNSVTVIAHASQGGLGLPDRDYYTRTDSASAALRRDYVAHVARLLELSGESAAQSRADAERVLALETRLANASNTRVQNRDPNATYNRMPVAELQRLTPHFDWTQYLRLSGASAATEINVRQPRFFATLDTVLATTPVEDWRAYFRWHALSDAADALSSPFVNEDFAWTARLSGRKELLPRWRRCATATNRVLGEALGAEYVKRTFTPEAKARALTMVNNLQAVLQERIGALGWMSDSTKQRATAKLAAFTKKIGYPDKWRDYSALQVKAGPYYDNNQRAAAWETRRTLAKLGKRVDRTEWGMTPPTVNAYYNPTMNEIVFPAGIMQPPFFDPNADDAVNYGAMGSVIGHEMTHGFDDQGRQFDAEGNLKDWWTTQDADQYKRRATLVSEQFDTYTVGNDSTLRVNGKLTLGENIADLGGVTIAYYALQKSLEGKPRPVSIDGFTPEQRFFLSWAQVWRRLQRPEAARLQVNTDPHSPAQWRVNGPLSNMPEFAAAFGCKAGDPMVRDEGVRAQIW